MADLLQAGKYCRVIHPGHIAHDRLFLIKRRKHFGASLRDSRKAILVLNLVPATLSTNEDGICTVKRSTDERVVPAAWCEPVDDLEHDVDDVELCELRKELALEPKRYGTRLLLVIDRIRAAIEDDPKRAERPWTREAIVSEAKRIIDDLTGRECDVIATALLSDEQRGKKRG